MNTETTFDFYYGDEGNQFSFCRIPRQLITEDTFKGLSSKAKLLYALMLQRMSLSARNGWYDELGRVFVYYTVNEIRATLNCGNDKAIKLLAELDTVKGIGLIERVKQGQGKPTKIFVKNFSKQIVPQENGPASALEDDTLDSQAQNCEESAVLTAEKSQPRVRKNRSQDIGKTEGNYIDMNYTYLSYINPSIYQGQGAVWAGHISTKVTNTAKQNLIYELNQPERENFNSESGPEPRTGRQRRLWRRCNSKYGILTAKFHLLGAPPLIPPKSESVEWHTTIEPEKKALRVGCSPLGARV